MWSTGSAKSNMCGPGPRFEERVSIGMVRGSVLQDALADAGTRGNWRVTMNVLDELMHEHLDREAAARVAQSALRSPDALSQARVL